jgi:hypothetical protein
MPVHVSTVMKVVVLKNTGLFCLGFCLEGRDVVGLGSG